MTGLGIQDNDAREDNQHGDTKADKSTEGNIPFRQGEFDEISFFSSDFIAYLNGSRGIADRRRVTRKRLVRLALINTMVRQYLSTTPVSVLILSLLRRVRTYKNSTSSWMLVNRGR